MKTENKTYKVIVDNLFEVETYQFSKRTSAVEFFTDRFGECEMAILREIDNNNATYREMARYTKDN